MNQMATEGGNEDVEQARRQLAFKMSFQYVDDSTIKPKDITVTQLVNDGPMKQALAAIGPSSATSC